MPVPDDAVLVVRGDGLDASVLKADASRFRRRSRRGAGTACRLPRRERDEAASMATAVLFRRSALEAAGVEVVPTFRTPHVTLAATMLAELVDQLLTCEHRVVANPYHEPEN